jgi:hypothetical protein
MPKTLVEQYLSAVGQFLPRAQRQDILRELAENLHDQFEDRELELGRGLSEAEQAAILQRHGDPLDVASQYRPQGRSVAFGRTLIGPALFPLYCAVLLLNLVIAVVVAGGLAFAQVGSEAVSPWSLLSSLLLRFAAVTAIFALVQQHLQRHPEYWSPQIWPAPPAEPRVSRFESLVQLVALGVFVSWLLALRQGAWPAGIDLPRPAPIWGQIAGPLLCLAVAGMIQAAISLAKPGWVRFAATARIAGDVAWLAILAALTLAGMWVIAPADATPEQLATFAAINRSCFLSLIVALLVSLVIAGFDLRTFVRQWRGSPGSQAGLSKNRAVPAN